MESNLRINLQDLYHTHTSFRHALLHPLSIEPVRHKRHVHHRASYHRHTPHNPNLMARERLNRAPQFAQRRPRRRRHSQPAPGIDSPPGSFCDENRDHKGRTSGTRLPPGAEEGIISGRAADAGGPRRRGVIVSRNAVDADQRSWSRWRFENSTPGGYRSVREDAKRFSWGRQHLLLGRRPLRGRNFALASPPLLMHLLP